MSSIEVLTRGLFGARAQAITTKGLAGVGTLAHVRALVRHRLAQRLVDAGAVESRVYTTRLLPLVSMVDLPAISVYVARDRLLKFSVGSAPRESMRELEVLVEIVLEEAEGAPPLDESLDAIGLLVEQIVLSGEETIGGIADDLWLGDVDAIDIEREAQRPIGMLSMVFHAPYTIEEPRIALQDLAGFAGTWNVGPEPDALIEAEDQLDTVP